MKFLDSLDHGTFVFFQHHRAANQDKPWLRDLVSYATEMGSNTAFVIMGLLAIGLAIWAKRTRLAVWMLIAFVGAGAATEGAKRLVAAPRPPDAVHNGERIQSGSFPSGHALKAAVGYSALALLAGSIFLIGRWRFLLYLLAAILIVLVGFTRIYLGVHYVTDVFGGWAFGMAWIMLCWKFAVQNAAEPAFSTGNAELHGTQ